MCISTSLYRTIDSYLFRRENMKPRINALIHVATATLILSWIVAEPIIGEPDLPVIPWEKHEGGVALAVVLVESAKNAVRSDFLRVYIRNISNAVEEYPKHGNDYGLRFFIKTIPDTWTPLHDYGPSTELASATHVDINPGETIHFDVILTPSGAASVKTHILKVLFVILDMPAGKREEIESSPRLLTPRQ
jgi:hypothetical protein